MPTNKGSDPGEPEELSPAEVERRRTWHQAPAFKDALFVCPDDGIRYDPPPYPAVCECGKDLVVAVKPRAVPTTKTLLVCSNCHSESQKVRVALANGEMWYCPVCGSTDPSIQVTLPLSPDETETLTARNAERARVRAAAETYTDVRGG